MAIVGRPNVGKSTLFNRIVGKRVAIVEKVAGVTRDRNYARASWRKKEFLLVDTGGFDPDPASDLASHIQDQLQLAIEEADILLFLVDAKEGLSPLDFEIASRLRKSEKSVLLVLNKVDDPRHEERIYEFYRLGIEPVFPLSAEHNEGISPLLDQLVRQLPEMESSGGEEADGTIRVAVVGRPNVGKSSLINRLLGEERLIVDDEPGTTVDTIDTLLESEGKRFLFVDTAGIRRKGKVSQRLEKYSIVRALRSIERADIVLVLLDAVEGVTKQDAAIAGYADEAYRGVLLVVNKWDLVFGPSPAKGKYLLEIQRQLKYLSHAPILFLSATTGLGVNALVPAVVRLEEEYSRRVPTAALNEAFREIIERHPAVHRGKPQKFYYITQASSRPPSFVCFVDDPQGVHFSYERYLKNQIRQRFGFGGAPIRLMFRRRKRRERSHL